MQARASQGIDLLADIVIIGGGIAGLWILNRLVQDGFRVLLLESSALGHGQSIASQGIIHGGLKYALSGNLGSATQAIAGMPERWRACLASNGDVDLGGCRVLSDSCFMWSEGSVRSRLKTFLGSKSLRARVTVLPAARRPAFFRENSLTGTVYQLPDFVIDAGSLLATLAAPHSESLVRIDPGSLQLRQQNDSDLGWVRGSAGGQAFAISAQRIILSAGAGNGELLQQAGLVLPTMQRRPLNMVMLKHASLPRVYCHCIGDDFSLTPKLTLTSHVAADGDTVWYLGGDLAERGVGLSDAAQIDAAKTLLKRLFPALDLAAARWACFAIDRAEGRMEGQHRPDSVFVSAQKNLIVTWPTKFTLSPALADEVISVLRAQNIVPSVAHDHTWPILPRPSLALAPWERGFQNA